MINSKLAAAAALFAASWAFSPANAATISVYNNDQPGWAAAAGSYTTETFSSTTLNPGLSVISTVGQVTGGLWSDRLVPGSQTTQWNFATPITAFGGNWDLTPGGPGTGIAFTVTFANNTTQSVGTEVPDSFSGEFFGFTSSLPIISVLETAGTQPGFAETYNLSNLVYSSTVPGPIPGAGFAGLAALALAGVYARVRRA